MGTRIRAGEEERRRERSKEREKRERRKEKPVLRGLRQIRHGG
jgi:hypothetical protein